MTPGFVKPETRPPLAVAVDADTAARASASGRIVLTVNGQSVPAQIVAVLPRFPVGSQHFIVADRPTVVSLLNQVAPGTAFVSQVWIAVPPESLATVRDTLESSPASAATLSFRADLARRSSVTRSPPGPSCCWWQREQSRWGWPWWRRHRRPGRCRGVAGRPAGAGARRSDAGRPAVPAAAPRPARGGGRCADRAGRWSAVDRPRCTAAADGSRGRGGRATTASRARRPAGARRGGHGCVGVVAASLVAAATAFRDAWPPATDLDLP